jgi:hypothetical protein
MLLAITLCAVLILARKESYPFQQTEGHKFGSFSEDC